jgi:hypothetical protein
LAAIACKQNVFSSAGPEAGIEGVIHAMQNLWELRQHKDDDWGFLLIDAKNAFNKQNRTIMPWTVRHECGHPGPGLHLIATVTGQCSWCSEATTRKPIFFTAKKVCRRESVAGRSSLHVCAWHRQHAHGTGILPLIRLLKAKFPKVEQPWHVDGTGGNFDKIRSLFHKLEEIGPDFGCFPEPLKNILAQCHSTNWKLSLGESTTRLHLVSENTHRTVASCWLNTGQISTMLFNIHRARFRLMLTKRPRSRFCREVSHACADSREVNHACADFHLSTHGNLVTPQQTEQRINPPTDP